MKKIYYFCLSIILTIFLISCSDESEEVENPPREKIQSPITFEHNGQEFEIISYYQEMLDFLEVAKEQPNNLENLYKQTVLDTLRKNGFGYSELSHWLFSTPSDIEAMEEAMDLLIDRQILLNNSIKEALVESATLLPGENKTIHVLPSLPENHEIMMEVNYVNGIVWRKNSMLILVDPLFLEQDLKYTVAHEYHHTIYKETDPNTYYTLLENTLVEGKADIFAEIIYPEINSQWTEPLSNEERGKVWNIFMENLDSKDYTIIEGFKSGSPVHGIPQWASYRIGNQIIQDFLSENPHLSVEEWTKMSASEIFHTGN